MAQNDDATSPTQRIGDIASATAKDAAKEVKAGAEEARAAASEAGDAISDDLRQLREDIARLTESIAAIAGNRGAAAASVVGDGVRAVRDTVYNTAADACAAGADVAGSARQHAASFATDVEDTVRRNPLGAVLTALGIGVVIGMMSRSR